MDRYFDIFLRLPPPRARAHTRHDLDYVFFLGILPSSCQLIIESNVKERKRTRSVSLGGMFNSDLMMFILSSMRTRERESFLLLFFSHTPMNDRFYMNT